MTFLLTLLSEPIYLNCMLFTFTLESPEIQVEGRTIVGHMSKSDRDNEWVPSCFNLPHYPNVVTWEIPDCWVGVERWTDPELPPRDLDGRGQGEGWWFEAQVAMALVLWGYLHIQGREPVHGDEVDVVARTGDESPGGPLSRIVVEAKDWADGPVGETDIYRLIDAAHDCRSYPVIAYTTSLTSDARDLAIDRGVTRLPLYDILYSDRMRAARPPHPWAEDSGIPDVLSRGVDDDVAAHPVYERGE